MKKTVRLLLIFSLILAISTAALCGCGSKNAKLARQAMTDGDYERALRLYKFALEKEGLSGDDERNYEILQAYSEASDALKKENFTKGLEIISGCKSDYSALAIKDDINALYNELSDGQYADERIKQLSTVISEKDFEKARQMVDEISKLTLTTAQREKFYSYSREVAEALSSDGNSVVLYTKGDPDDTVAIYSEADSNSDIIYKIPGGEEVSVLKSSDENNYMHIQYDEAEGFVRASDLTTEKPSAKAAGGKEDDDEDEDEGKKDQSADKDKADEKDDEKGTPDVEAASAGDKLYVITSVNLRSDPNTDCEVIDIIPAGSEVTYLGETEHGFYKVKYNGETGYAYCDYLQK